jgi:uncharacterized protein YgiM (DUF1202 family)
MKKNCWIFVGTLLTTSLLAQTVTNPPPAAPVETPPPAPAMTNVTPPTNSAPAEMAAPTAESATATTNAPATKSAKKKKKKSGQKAVAEKSGSELKTVPLVAGPAVCVATHVNVRGQPKLKSEILTRLTNDQPVTVIEEIVRNDSGPDEPSAWAKIALPAGAHAWINTGFIDTTAKTVKPKKLNVRSGPGENFSVLGTLQKGDSIQEVTTKGDWTEIEPPASAYAFVAAQYLRQGAAAPTTDITSTAPTTTTTVAEAAPVATTTTETPATTTAPTNAVAETTAPTNTAPETASTPTTPEPPPKRIVQHEGFVRGTFSIQAPTPFALVGEDGRLIDYLYTSSPDLDLRRYKGLRIVVTGEEAIEERWPSTPIITIQKISVLSDVSGESH